MGVNFFDIKRRNINNFEYSEFPDGECGLTLYLEGEKKLIIKGKFSVDLQENHSIRVQPNSVITKSTTTKIGA